MIKVKRLFHLIKGHNYSKSKKLDTFRTEHHYASDKDWIYTIHVMECECGLSFLDAGVERRKKPND